ncbi:MAG: AbrB family transcriptional regulator [Alphaproteobacteria bacterium HGW-Alphaproteobacteria-3]|nr:MAG: AbrB family transcriptional regulator [Alphaproteobacteria bacterium HGW-Alphaproteobacteria-3]
MGAKEGDRIFLKPIDGKLQIMSKTAALEEMRKLVRQYIPEGVNLADELIADRRREVAREAKGRG